nr:immunoglobulin heavy chain junction region [Macaca mulatta]MOW21151.1 immunoglobulin heavy chain junction region [Macaca mulatta]MOW21680.1 immunoglobulin heavy chain junction region [Macaca mulatta]MOY21387.1 immunoglobulin heavy chain junction region [Macaca mulatta]MOY22245.1 immunoglobulin heavy chain junction region [Macaca mulatta]
CTRQQSNFDYW